MDVRASPANNVTSDANDVPYNDDNHADIPTGNIPDDTDDDDAGRVCNVVINAIKNCGDTNAK
jgi:hypothetical protein